MKARKDLVNDWINANRPYGLDKLAKKAELSPNSLKKIRAGRPVQSIFIRRALARALGVKESELFPSDQGKSRAS